MLSCPHTNTDLETNVKITFAHRMALISDLMYDVRVFILSHSYFHIQLYVINVNSIFFTFLKCVHQFINCKYLCKIVDVQKCKGIFCLSRLDSSNFLSSLLLFITFYFRQPKIVAMGIMLIQTIQTVQRPYQQ